MPDYNIYIHGSGDSSSGSQAKVKTTPIDNREDNESVAPFIQKGMQNAYGIMQGNTGGYVGEGIAALSKVSPWIALAVTAIKITDNILTTGSQHWETYTGDYRFSMEYNNFKTLVGNFINPIKTVMTGFSRQKAYELQNRVIEQERTLVGTNYEVLTHKGV